jgi:predicted MFS family arabinose efflux permease
MDMMRLPAGRHGGALVVAHVAGMIDLVALPVWVGVLMTAGAFDARAAGALVTLYLLGVVASCVGLAPRLGPARERGAIVAAFLVSALAFAALGKAHHGAFAGVAVLDLVAGLAVGVALSLTHRRIGRAANPHRLFAGAGLALGVFSVLFLAGVPQLVAALGGGALFVVFAGVMAVAALVALTGLDRATGTTGVATRVALSPAARWAIAGVVCMTVVQATVFSFVERLGAARGFAPGQVQGVLIALGLVNLLPAPLAALLERRLEARRVALAGPVLQCVLAAVICSSTAYAPFAVAAAVFVAVMIFCHTFVFGLLAWLDPSGRATALTPAMLMSGSAIGPVLGSVAVQWGLPAIGFAAAGVAAIGLACFARLPRATPLADPTFAPPRPAH